MGRPGKEARGLEQAWSFLWDRFFDRRTFLFYDYLVDDPARGGAVNRPDAATWHLPAPELIRRGIPNPCGCGTGMEDSVLTAGTVMDTIAARHAVTGEPQLGALAADVYRGMALCMDVCSRPGFVARSVSPADGKSHYPDSSRDQYTHWVWGAWVLYRSPLAGAAQRASVRTHLAAIAAACERDVRPENDWNLLREDGKPGLVCKMWGDLKPHEYLRLPMFYAAAWKTAGDPRWGELYRRYREEAFERSLPFRCDSGYTYTGLQMQYSLRLLFEAEEDEAWRRKYLALMTSLAEQYAPLTVPRAEALLRPEGLAGLNWAYRPWNEVPASWAGFVGGKAYYCPGQSEFPDNRAFYPLRAVGESAAIAALCPGFRPPAGTVEALEALAAAVDYARHHTYAPLALVNAYWRLRAGEETEG